jgi:hypothetical protein
MLLMATEKYVQVKLNADLYKQAKIGLAKLDMSWQEFLEEYIRLKFGKRRKNGEGNG